MGVVIFLGLIVLIVLVWTGISFKKLVVLWAFGLFIAVGYIAAPPTSSRSRQAAIETRDALEAIRQICVDMEIKQDPNATDCWAKLDRGLAMYETSKRIAGIGN